MITVLVIMTVGIALGWFLHKKEQFLKLTARLTNWAIYLLLFLLGLSVGSDKQILSSFDKIGLQSIIITLFAVAGSILVSWLTYILFFKENER